MIVKPKLKVKIMVFSIVVFVLLLVSAFFYLLGKTADEYARNSIKNELTLKLNNVFAENLKKHSAAINNAFVIHKENGDVKSVTVETYKLNSFVADMITDSALCIESSRDSFSLPIGNSFGLRILSGTGPKIRFTVIPVGSVSSVIDSRMVTSGINQNLYRVVIRINAAVRLLYPFGNYETEISLEYVICEILIVGKVPEFYFSRDAIP